MMLFFFFIKICPYLCRGLIHCGCILCVHVAAGSTVGVQAFRQGWCGGSRWGSRAGPRSSCLDSCPPSEGPYSVHVPVFTAVGASEIKAKENLCIRRPELTALITVLSLYFLYLWSFSRCSMLLSPTDVVLLFIFHTQHVRGFLWL